MNNPFELIEDRFNARFDKLEKLILDNNRPAITLEPRDKPRPFFTTDGLAEFLGVVKPTIYTKHSKGELPGGFKRGKRLYFDRETILNWIKEGHQKSKVEIEAEAEAFLNSKK
ncbi:MULTISPECIES: helix-turn-helix transcriptional regulator [Flavobacteriaceae]|uniref:helix-turn-helix transcriptional regulator n=1 Tax=Flavobacteriaceae TaxID=49546 RepID=UPI0014914ED0|nr:MULTISPECIES: helix-turn-helix domain-containing protein [Allomuricauda]MDC6366925.1 helix-turn-helix domain-containing protein [Muricauda sp. AC10]